MLLKGLCSRTVAVIECGKVGANGKLFLCELLRGNLFKGCRPFWEGDRLVFTIPVWLALIQQKSIDNPVNKETRKLGLRLRQVECHQK